MKKLLLSAAIAFTALSAYADFTGTGYYRVQNAMTKRYAYLLDDKGSFDNQTGSADVSALKLFKDPQAVISDPSTVFYIDCVKGMGSTIMECNIAGQGTSLYAFFGQYMNLMAGKKVDGIQTYLAYASRSGFTRYLGDLRENPKKEEGNPSVAAVGDLRLWYIDPVVADSENSYFGVAPTVDVQGRHYEPFFAGFPFEPYSGGMKVYTVSHVDSYNQVAVLKEVKDVVPAGTPVIIECSASQPSSNRLNIGGSASAVTGNLLKGVYFNNEEPYNHRNRTAYDKRTMRLLTEKNGQLTFDQANVEWLPRNQAYLQLSNDAEYAVASYRVMNEDDYEAQYGAVDVIAVDAAVDVYSVDGCLVKSGILRSDVYGLGKGVYILRSGAMMEKLLVP
ncbi:MAG: hypothetical protein K2J58_03935 [Muribaculaceae bacterium]|nr:hypothetical protein [Muribaculaceae bacterium]